MSPGGNSRALEVDLCPLQLHLLVIMKPFTFLPLCLQRIIMLCLLPLDLKTFGPITIGMQRREDLTSRVSWMIWRWVMRWKSKQNHREQGKVFRSVDKQESPARVQADVASLSSECSWVLHLCPPCLCTQPNWNWPNSRAVEGDRLRHEGN